MIEAIVVLVIASMVLSALLPLVVQSTRQNARYGTHALQQAETAMDERMFRTLILSATPERQAALGRPATTTMRGSQQAMEFVALVPDGFACAGPGETAVTLRIEASPDLQGGSLVCNGTEGVRTLTKWARGIGTFAYRLGSEEWSAIWPPAGQDEQKWMFAADGPVIRAPYVKFQIASDDKSALAWIAQAGMTAPMEFDATAMLSDGMVDGAGP